MKFKIRKRHAVIAGINALCIAGALALTAAGDHAARAQLYNYSADKWDSSGGSTQISCFFSEDSGQSVQSVAAIRSALTKALSDVNLIAEDGKSLFTDAYSTPAGTVQVQSDGYSHSEAELTVVGGDFFYFRDFRLLSGAFFSEGDFMQDGAVIDRSLAWNLYGSDNVAGMKLTIQSKDYFISGVIDTPKNKEEKYCAGDAPRIYISYEGAAGLGLASALSEAPPPEEGMTPEFSDITLYEVISPDSVENYSLNTLKKYFGDGDPERLLIVDNTHRFAPSRLAGMFRKRWKNSVINSKLSLPWWENASRIAEYKLAPVYFFRRLLFIPPVLTVLWLLYLAWLFVSRNKGRFISAVIDKIYQINYKRHMKKKQKEVE
jgi:hypothetical protein